MKRPLLLAHGWGFDRTVWDPVAERLAGRTILRVEAGYLGAAPTHPDVPDGAVLVGHSAGLMALLRNGVPANCAGLVAINGFTRFTAAERFPGVPDRTLERMARGFAVSPETVLRSFRQRCGDEAGSVATANHASLAAGLRALKDDDLRDALRTAEVPVLALAARDDPIVSESHARACFGVEQLRWTESGGHLLPLTRAGWCSDMIGAFAC